MLGNASMHQCIKMVLGKHHYLNHESREATKPRHKKAGLFLCSNNEPIQKICWFCIYKKRRHSEYMKWILIGMKLEELTDCLFDNKMILCKCIHWFGKYWYHNAYRVFGLKVQVMTNYHYYCTDYQCNSENCFFLT